jgi:hypothetical protein
MSKHARRKSATLKRPKSKLGLPDLDHSMAAVLDSLRSPESKRGYPHASTNSFSGIVPSHDFFNKIVVTRYRIFLENRSLAPALLTAVLPLRVGWHMRPPTLACSVPSSPQVSGALKA